VNDGGWKELACRRGIGNGDGLVDLGFILELWVLGFNRFELNGHLFPRNNVDAEVDVT